MPLIFFLKYYASGFGNSSGKMTVDFFSNFKSGTGYKSPDNRSSVISSWFREKFYIFKVNVIFAAKRTFFKKKKLRYTHKFSVAIIFHSPFSYLSNKFWSKSNALPHWNFHCVEEKFALRCKNEFSFSILRNCRFILWYETIRLYKGL